MDVEKELREALAAMQMRAESAEIYLAQAEARIAELEAELRKAKEDAKGGATEISGVDQFYERYYKDEPREWERAEEYKRKASDSERYEKQQRYEALQRWMAAGGEMPKDMKGLAEKYLNEFLDKPPLGMEKGPKRDYAGRGYRIAAHAGVGDVEFRVSTPGSDKMWAWRFADNTSFNEFQKTTTMFIPELMENLNLGNRPEVGAQMLKDFVNVMAAIRNGSMTHAIQRGGD